MSKTIYTLLSICIVLSSACQSNIKKRKAEILQSDTSTISNNLQEIPFVLAKNYFVHNNVKFLDNPKIETQEKFNEIFGMASTMGEDGKPTSIDFTKQMVLALVLNETEIETNVSPLQLRKKGKVLTLNYKLVTGQNQSYTSRPFFAVIIEKIETDNIIFNEVK